MTLGMRRGVLFDPAGDLLGRTHSPPDMTLFEVHSDFVVVVDDFDVPVVRRYPLLSGVPEGEP